MNRFFRSAFFPLIVIVLLVWLASETLFPKSTKSAKMTSSELQHDIRRNPEKFEEVIFDPNKRSITATLRQGRREGDKVTVHYASDQAQLAVPEPARAKKSVKFDSKGTGGFSWARADRLVLPFLLLIGFWIFLMNQVQGGGSKVMSFGKSRAKRMAPDSPKIGFKDVAGVDEAVEELQEIKEFLENPKKFQALGARIPKGVLLYGPPGTGKTLLARAVAGEAGVPFFSISGSDFVEMFVGVGASRVRDLFEQAKQALAVHRLHGRDRRRRPPSRRRPRRRPRRARADAEPAARRDGRLRDEGQHHPDRRHEPARHPRPGAAAPGPLRPADRRRPARPERPPQDPRGAHEGQAARRRRSTSTRSPPARPASPAPTSRTSSTRPRCSPRATARR